VLLVGIPSVFPERGGVAQTFWGLLVCFLTFGAHVKFSPFVRDSDDVLAQLAQLQIFLTLLSSLALRTSPPSALAGSFITFVLFAVPIVGLVLQRPEKVDKKLGQAWAKMRKLMGRCTGPCAHIKRPPLKLEATRPLSPKLEATTATNPVNSANISFKDGVKSDGTDPSLNA
jgi:hypothetical protein